MDAFEKWADDCDETDEKYYVVPVGSAGRAVAKEAFRAGMRRAAEIVAKQRMTVAGHMKPYEPIDAINAELLLEDCADACDEIAKAILSEADK